MQVHADGPTMLRNGAYWPGGALLLLVAGLTLYAGTSFASWEDGSAAATCVMGGALALLGAGLALYRDRVIVDPIAGTYLAERGFGPLARTTSGSISELRGVSVQREVRSTNDGHWYEWVVKVEMPEGHRPVQVHAVHDHAWGVAGGKSARAAALEHGAAVARALRLTVIDQESGNKRTLSADEASQVAAGLPTISREQALRELGKGHVGAVGALAFFALFAMGIAVFGDRLLVPDALRGAASPWGIVFLTAWNLLLFGAASGLLWFAWAILKSFGKRSDLPEREEGN